MTQPWIIGIDEVGRGPLAGPITVAAVVADREWLIANVKLLKNIKDSKQLSPKQRNQWKKIICANFRYAITSVRPSIIDQKGISYAARYAVARCLKKLASSYSLSARNCEVFLDGGLVAPQLYVHQHTIIKGDETEPLIAAASILAKVRRDRYMVQLDKKLPQYGFYQHKGYGTHSHRQAIQTHGLSGYHRTSFCGGTSLPAG